MSIPSLKKQALPQHGSTKVQNPNPSPQGTETDTKELTETLMHEEKGKGKLLRMHMKGKAPLTQGVKSKGANGGK